MIIPVFDELKNLIKLSGLSVPTLAKESGVHPKTLHTWLDGQVHMPRIDTMLRVARVVGRHIELTETIQKMVGFYPPPPPRMSRHAVRMALMRLQ